MTEGQVTCEIYQKGELYDCKVYLGKDLNGGNAYVCIRVDKVKITYNTSRKLFIMKFLVGGRVVSEAYVNKIYIYDMEKENNIRFPEIDVEWPYENIIIEMKED